MRRDPNGHRYVTPSTHNTPPLPTSSRGARGEPITRHRLDISVTDRRERGLAPVQDFIIFNPSLDNSNEGGAGTNHHEQEVHRVGGFTPDGAETTSDLDGPNRGSRQRSGKRVEDLGERLDLAARRR